MICQALHWKLETGCRRVFIAPKPTSYREAFPHPMVTIQHHQLTARLGTEHSYLAFMLGVGQEGLLSLIIAKDNDVRDKISLVT